MNWSPSTYCKTNTAPVSSPRNLVLTQRTYFSRITTQRRRITNGHHKLLTSVCRTYAYDPWVRAVDCIHEWSTLQDAKTRNLGPPFLVNDRLPRPAVFQGPHLSKWTFRQKLFPRKAQARSTMWGWNDELISQEEPITYTSTLSSMTNLKFKHIESTATEMIVKEAAKQQVLLTSMSLSVLTWTRSPRLFKNCSQGQNSNRSKEVTILLGISRKEIHVYSKRPLF